MTSEDQDKSEEPTPYRLEEARKQGEVSKSAEVSGWVVMAAFAITLALTGGWVARTSAAAMVESMAYAGIRPVFGAGMIGWVFSTYYPVLQSLFPLVLLLIIGAVSANLFQTGPIFTVQPISPNFQRLNPKQAVKRLFSMKSIIDVGKMLLKMALLGAVLFIAYHNVSEFVARIARSNPSRIAETIFSVFLNSSLFVLAVLALMALLDLIFVRREYLKKMRMSRRDLRDEVKKRDGDPEVKAKQRQLIREVLKKARSVPKVSEADVILTNPTHIAVALKYCPKTMRAPIVLSKGAGFVGEQIRRVARQNKVPIIRMPALARHIYRECAIEAAVSESMYGRIAVVYRWLYSQQSRAVP